MKNFKSIFSKMQEAGMTVPQETFSIAIPNAREFFTAGMRELIVQQQKHQFVWLPEYDDVIKWLENSDGKSLFLYGNCGRGKSLIARHIIPAAFYEYYNKIITVTDAITFAKNIDDIINRKFICVDDIGTEDFTNEYGSKRMAFSELMDQSEKYQKILIITTNLNSEQIREKYGDRTLDRIKSTCKRVCFQGKSFRF